MVNKAIGWQGSGTRPGKRARPRDKGTVYWIDLPKERDVLFEAFATHMGMEKRDAAKALMAVVMGLLPATFWDSPELGGFTGAERMNLIRQVFPKGSGHTNRAPHARWKATWDSRILGAPGGVGYIGLLIEREKQKLEAIVSGESELKAEMEEEEFKEAQREAKIQLRELAKQRRLRLLERGIIVTGRDDMPDNDVDEDIVDDVYDLELKGTGAAISRARKVDRIRPEGEDILVYDREKRKNRPAIEKAREIEASRRKKAAEAEKKMRERAEESLRYVTESLTMVSQSGLAKEDIFEDMELEDE